MYPKIELLKKILVSESYVSEADSKAAEAASQDSADYVAYLIQHELMTKSLLGQAIAEAYKIPFAETVNAEASAKLPEEIARTMRLAVVDSNKDGVMLATDTPETVDPAKIKDIFKGKRLRLSYALPETIDSAFSRYDQPLETRFSKIIENSRRVAPEIVDEIIRDALTFRASDIHFEPRGETVTIRFRVDGALRQAGTIAKDYYDNILNRVKVESGMRIDEHLSSQDGSMRRNDAGQQVDLRVSLIPTVEGEKVVMRVLGSYLAGFGFDDLHFSDAHRDMIERNLAKPFGMILATGPTGAGKTTTLYALLKQRNLPDVNITTIEDPVEYKLAGTNQIQVRENGAMTFAKGLRSIVRQDPDVILVGEIRDQETAEISVNAALTGHLLLSSFHANDAATAIPRLVDMGVEPFLLSSTLEVIISQRLVRKLCTHCRYSLSPAEAMKDVKTTVKWQSLFGKTDVVYASKGCQACNESGYNGRVALYELIEVTPQMQELILKAPSTAETEALARKQGSASMFNDGIDKVKLGLTSVAEVIRVVPPAVGA